MFGIVYLTGWYCLIQLTLLKTDLIDSCTNNLLYMIQAKNEGTRNESWYEKLLLV